MHIIIVIIIIAFHKHFYLTTHHVKLAYNIFYFKELEFSDRLNNFSVQ